MIENCYKLTHNNIPLTFFDVSTSAPWIINEIFFQNSYNLDHIQLSPGDIVIDIGANIGILSIYLALKFQVKVLAFEPLPSNYAYLKKNIEENKAYTVYPFPLAVTGDGRFLELRCMTENLGGANAYVTNEQPFMTAQASSITLQHIFDSFSLDKVKLLKIDCEGGEYEIFQSTPQKYLKRIEYLIGEFHHLFGTEDPKPLLEQCRQIFGNKMQVQTI